MLRPTSFGSIGADFGTLGLFPTSEAPFCDGILGTEIPDGDDHEAMIVVGQLGIKGIGGTPILVTVAITVASVPKTIGTPAGERPTPPSAGGSGSPGIGDGSTAPAGPPETVGQKSLSAYSDV